MTISRKFIIFLLISAVLLSGCATFPRGEEVQINYYGSINSSDDGFRMNGELLAEGGIPEQDTFHDVTVALYSQNGVQLYSEELGSLKANQGNISISISISEIPHYVVFDSDDFWKERIEVEYYERQDGEYRIREVTSKAELPM